MKMKIEFIEKKEDVLKFKIFNNKHSIPELLKNRLLKNEDVIMASYLLEHFEDKDVIFWLRVKKGKKAKTILNKAINDIIKDLKEFKTQSINQLNK